MPLDIFQIDDGFTPEMGDWLEVKPQFPRGMQPLLNEAAAAGFRPGLWIAPFLVGNRSRLFVEHPDWVVQDTGGGPLRAFFYGEFRWHKRSEEYYDLDITHPAAEEYIRRVFRTWTRDWGARDLKADFLLHGAEYGPDRARWHQPGLSRIAIWRKMMAAIRMTQAMPWFGPRDSVTLAGIRQARAAGIVTALHEVPNGEIWEHGQIADRKAS